MSSTAKEEPEELRDSVMSSSSPSVGVVSSTDASVSEESVTGEGGGSWFGLGDLSSIARSLKRSIPPAIDSITNVIQRSAMTVAAEFTQLERDAEELRWRQAVENGEVTELPLPWELSSTPDEELAEKDNEGSCSSVVFVEDENLKDKILALSLVEDTFTTPFVVTGDSEPDFELDDERIHLIRRLLEIDANLNTAHEKIDDNCEHSETQVIIFWKNYFYHCERLRSGNEVAETEVVEEEEEPEQRSLETDGNSDFVETSTTGSRGIDGCEVLSLSSDDASPPPHTFSTNDLVLVGLEGDDLDDLAADIVNTKNQG